MNCELIINKFTLLNETPFHNFNCIIMTLLRTPLQGCWTYSSKKAKTIVVSTNPFTIHIPIEKFACLPDDDDDND